MMDILNMLYTDEEIKKQAKCLADRIYDDYHNDDEELVLIGILKGAYMFLADLSRELYRLPHLIDFISLSSYGDRGSEQGEVRFLLDTTIDVKGKNVILVEDIIDSGNTINYLLDVFKSKQANSVRICSLLKRKGNQTDKSILYSGFEVEENKWVVGYGMDYKEKYRDIKSIFYISNKGE